MTKQLISFNIPILMKSNSNEVYCPLLNTTFTVEELSDDRVSNETLGVEIIQKPSDKRKNLVFNVNMNYIKNLGSLVNKLYDLIVEKYKRDRYLPESAPLSKYAHIKLNEGDFWLTYEIKVEIEKGLCEKILPKIYLGSAIIYQGLTLCTSAISIYVKGLSIPVTLTLSASSALLAIINFTQADASSNIARIGRYLDHISPRRSFNDLANLKNKKQLSFSAFIFSGILFGAIFGDAASIFSQTEIIDGAGRDSGLTFLTDDVIFIHGFVACVCGAIAYGTFGGNFAVKAAIKFSDWLYSIMNDTAEATTESQTKQEISPLISYNK